VCYKMQLSSGHTCVQFHDAIESCGAAGAPDVATSCASCNEAAAFSGSFAGDASCLTCMNSGRGTAFAASALSPVLLDTPNDDFAEFYNSAQYCGAEVDASSCSPDQEDYSSTYSAAADLAAGNAAVVALFDDVKCGSCVHLHIGTVAAGVRTCATYSAALTACGVTATLPTCS